MRSKNKKINGMMYAGLIIVISFVYAINVQPVVVGNPDVSTNHNDQLESYQTVYDTLNKDVEVDNNKNHQTKSFKSKNLAVSPSPPQIAHLNSNLFRYKYLINSDFLDDLLIKIFVNSWLYC